MRATIPACALAAVALSAGGSPCAASPWYLAGDLSADFHENTNLTLGPTQRLLVPVLQRIGNSPTPVVIYVPETVMTNGGGQRVFDPGWGGHLAVGYRLAPRFRLEAEIGATTYEIKRESLGLGGASQTVFNRLSGGRYSGESVSLNAYYDFHSLSPRFTPFVGLGGGALFDRTGSGVLADARGRRAPVSGGKASDGFALAEVGVSTPLTPHWSIAPAYRYVRGLGSGDRMGSHIVKVGARFAF